MQRQVGERQAKDAYDTQRDRCSFKLFYSSCFTSSGLSQDIRKSFSSDTALCRDWAALAQHYDDLVCSQKQAADAAKRDIERQVLAFQQTRQGHHTSSEWDLNRPDRFLLDSPARWVGRLCSYALACLQIRQHKPSWSEKAGCHVCCCHQRMPVPCHNPMLCVHAHNVKPALHVLNRHSLYVQLSVCQT